MAALAALAAPEYACAILRDPAGCLLLERRPLHTHRAARRLTCFGGAVEPGETAWAALRRELAEELAWVPLRGGVACDLRWGPRWIARFFDCGIVDPVSLRREARRRLRRVAPAAALRAPISPWHQVALAAWARGGGLARLSGPA